MEVVGFIFLSVDIEGMLCGVICFERKNASQMLKHEVN